MVDTENAVKQQNLAYSEIFPPTPSNTHITMDQFDLLLAKLIDLDTIKVQLISLDTRINILQISQDDKSVIAHAQRS